MYRHVNGQIRQIIGMYFYKMCKQKITKQRSAGIDFESYTTQYT